MSTITKELTTKELTTKELANNSASLEKISVDELLPRISCLHQKWACQSEHKENYSKLPPKRKTYIVTHHEQRTLLEIEYDGDEDNWVFYMADFDQHPAIAIQQKLTSLQAQGILGSAITKDAYREMGEDENKLHASILGICSVVLDERQKLAYAQRLISQMRGKAESQPLYQGDSREAKQNPSDLYSSKFGFGLRMRKNQQPLISDKSDKKYEEHFPQHLIP